MSDAALKAEAISSIIAQASEKQRTASDPAASSWVGASAGSGKTKVLTDRLLRLLLPRENGEPGTKPEKILALTFTKAGANEMALRLSKRLSGWATASDEDLIKDMEENLFGRRPTQDEMIAARKLFARVVDTPGGLKIMTIHSFCQSVLGRFPIEAGVSPHFKPLEEGAAKELLDQARAEILSHAGTRGLSPLANAAATIGTAMTEEQFSQALTAMISERHQLAQILKRTFGIDGLYTSLCSTLDIIPGLTESQAIQAFCREVRSYKSDLVRACGILLQSKSKTDRERGDYLRIFLEAPEDERPAHYAAYRKAFFTTKGNIRDSFATKPVQQEHPDIISILSYEAERILQLENERKAIMCAALTRDLIYLGTNILERYEFLKQSRGALDFDDMILKTLSLIKGNANRLKGLEVTAWILYKLDEGLDHILLDEAQDTNPEQWEIIRTLSDEFFNGMGAKENTRTIFVVGDEKQSIFSFQRAAPRKFGEMYRWFENRIRLSGQRFSPVDINTSFRSVQVVLDAVDKVFQAEKIKMGLSVPYLPHTAKRQGQAGLVELWPVYESGRTDANDEEEGQLSLTGWDLPDKIVETPSGSLQMANKIGDTISSWLQSGEILESYDRPIAPGDIMVLVRTRNAFVSQLVRVLKKHKIPVSGVDRMVLGDQIVVQDLVALAGFALLPDDDLTLACVLKSPFIGLDEEALYALANERKGTLWQSLKTRGDKATIDWLEKLIERAGYIHPYEFFSLIIQEACPADGSGGLHAIRTRLGDDALDPLNEFLHTALTYEEVHAPGLQGFLKRHADGHTDIKRQMEEAGNAVRIMTVHGSKGLQAPIVFLPDTVRTQSSLKNERILWPHKTGLDVPFYVSSKDTAPPAVLAARASIEDEMEEEYKRLLYVAMTRAEERLYIGGYTGKRKPGEDSKTSYWYEDIRMSLAKDPAIVTIPSGLKDDEGHDIPILRLSQNRIASPDKTPKEKGERKAPLFALPQWIKAAAPNEPSPPKPLVPSRPSMDEPAAQSPLTGQDNYKFQRGNLTHKLMQILPELPHQQRQAAAEAFLKNAPARLPPEIQTNIVGEVMAILNNPDFSAIFGGGSMAEVPVTGLLKDGRLISGQIDRVLIGQNEILIIDYKTNRPPPLLVENVPAIYVKQMRAYADVLAAIYPGRKIRMALLWTMDTRLMEIPY